jgi:hypothetical protein
MVYGPKHLEMTDLIKNPDILTGNNHTLTELKKLIKKTTENRNESQIIISNTCY